MKKRILLLTLLTLFVTFTGCKTAEKVEKTDYNRPLMPGERALVKITDPAMIPDLTPACQNVYMLEDAINNSLDYMAKPSSTRFFPIEGITHNQVKQSLKAFKDIIHSNMSPGQMNDVIKHKFDFYMSVGCDRKGTVLFTGYYTPIFNGSLEQTSRFRYPLYKMPEDLVKNEDGITLGRKILGGAIAQYPTRAQIESSKMLKGNELIWLEDPFEVYIAHVQGSAKIRLADQRLITVGYAATNGHEYKSITKSLSADGAIPLDKMSLSAMIEYFKTHKDEVGKYINTNPRFVFFRTSKGNPTGSINAPVTPMRTIATDKSIFPRASLTFVDTSLPRLIGSEVEILPFKGFTLDQDTGGAIRAAGRCDFYMGQGDEAGLVAGKTYEEGQLYYLILKN